MVQIENVPSMQELDCGSKGCGENYLTPSQTHLSWLVSPGRPANLIDFNKGPDNISRSRKSVNDTVLLEG